MGKNVFHLYIIYSSSLNKYYVGFAENYEEALEMHNANADHKYTGKAQDWTFKAVFTVADNKEDALELAKFINRQKNDKLLMKLIDPAFVPADKLEVLKRIA